MSCPRPEDAGGGGDGAFPPPPPPHAAASNDTAIVSGKRRFNRDINVSFSRFAEPGSHETAAEILVFNFTPPGGGVSEFNVID
jgi:hypothetical protein